MRETKFRGMVIHKGTWVYGYLAGDDQIMKWQRNGTGNMYQVLPETVGEYTGLQDKNGVEIYEGDIVYEDMEGYGEVGFGEFEAFCGFALTDGDEDNIEIEMVGFHIGDRPLGRDKDYEVIGNIHENPELLKGD